VEQSLSIRKELKTLFNTDVFVKTTNQEHDKKSDHFLDRLGGGGGERDKEREKCFI